MPANHPKPADQSDDADHLALKLELLAVFRRALEISGPVNQSAVAQTLGVNQADVSRLLNGNPAKFSAWRLMSMLNKLGYDVTIGVGPAKADRGIIKVINEI